MKQDSPKKQRFFQVALSLIHEKGFQATTLRMIAEQLGCDVANVYNYIDSKQGLLEKFLFGISAEFHQGMQQIRASTYSPQDKLRAVIHLHVKLATEKPHVVSLLANEWRNLREPRLSAFVAEREAYENGVKAILKEGIASGTIRAMDLEIATFTFLSSVRWLFSWVTQQQEVNPFELEKQLGDFVFLGMRAED